MAASVSVCKVGLHWDSPKAPRVYSQPKLVPKGFQNDKRIARRFNSQFGPDTASACIKAMAADSSSRSSSSSSCSSSSSSSCMSSSNIITSSSNARKTLRVLDESMQTRLQGRSAAMMGKLNYAKY